MDLSKIDNDFSEEEVEKVNTFVANGCMGLDRLVADEHKMNSLFGLYMSGRTYTEVSKIAKVKKDLVLYMAAKMRWYEKRMEYINDLELNITKKMLETRVESLNFISSLISMHHKYYGDAINDYMRTGDRDIIDSLDLKQLTQYFKGIDQMEKLLNPTNVNRGGGSGVKININATGGSIEHKDDKTIDITPGKVGDALKALSKIKDDKKEE